VRGAARFLPFFAAAFLVASTAAAQEQYFEEPSAKPKFTLNWDFLARYDEVDHREYFPPLERGRFQLRPEGGFEPTSNLRIAVRAIFDYSTQKDSDPFVDNYIAREAAIERYYVLWRPGQFALRGGAFGMPLFATQMLWDKDIQTPGAAAAWESRDGAWTLAGAWFYGPQHDHDHSQIFAGQAVWRSGELGPFRLEAGAAYWSFDLRNLRTLYIRENTPEIVNGTTGYLYGYHVADLLVRARFRLGSVPFLVSLDGIRNFSAPDGKRLAFEGALVAGQLGTPWAWQASYAYQYVERDALVGAYNSDDWWWHTWFEGHRVTLAFTVLPQVYVQGSVSFNRRLDQNYWLNRYMVDLVKIF
jgi:hypothetical protein